MPLEKKVFPGWWVLAGGFIGYFAYSAHFNTTYGVFIYHLGAEMGWSRTALAGVTTLGRLPEAILAPWVGSFIDRHGGRRVMACGGLVVGVGFLLLSSIQDIWQLYVCRGIVVAAGAVLSGPLVFVVAANNWFVEKRGTALGVLRTADTLGTALMPVAAAALIAVGGWRTAWTIMGIGLLLLIVPASTLLRRRPEDYGLSPDGRSAGIDGGPRSRRAELLAAEVVWTRQAALRCPTLWALTGAYALSHMALVATNVHLVPYVQELGYPITVAAAVVGGRAYIQLLVNPLWGLAVERIRVQLLAASQSVLAAASLLIFSRVASELSLAIGLLLLGISSAGFYLTLEVMWANFFGRVSLGTVRGIAQPVGAVFSALGPLVAGLLYDLTGNYNTAWVVLAGAFTASAGVVLLARRPAPPDPPPVDP